MRTIILHYHLFKNAGTSIDEILKSNFKEKWITTEFKASEDNSEEIKAWILDNPEAVAFSSHTMTGPVPKIHDTNIISIILLRNPIRRIISAYKFERNQQVDTWGANLAKQVNFEDYVVTRLLKDGDTQCRNFQSERLATMTPTKAPNIERAMTALDNFSMVGIVEEFEKTLSLLESILQNQFENFKVESTHKNRSNEYELEFSPALNQLLHECNNNDKQVWKAGLEKLKKSMNNLHASDAKAT